MSLCSQSCVIVFKSRLVFLLMLSVLSEDLRKLRFLSSCQEKVRPIKVKGSFVFKSSPSPTTPALTRIIM